MSGLEFRLIAVPAFRVSGIAIDDSGRVVGDAMITLVSAVVRSQGGFTPPLIGRSNADGSFAIGGVIAGRYSVIANRMTRTVAGASAVVSFERIGTSSGSEIQIDVDGANVTGLKVIVPPPQ